MLAVAAHGVSEHYPNVLMSDKQQAWSALGLAMVTVYGPRVFSAVRKRRAAPKPAPKTTPPSNVSPFPINGGVFGDGPTAL